MITTLLLPIIGTGTAYCINLYRHVHKPFYIYLIAFLVGFAACYTIDCYADEEYEIQCDLLALYHAIDDEGGIMPEPCVALTTSQQTMYWNAWQACAEAGYRKIEDARQISLFIPNIDRRQKINTAIVVAVNSLLNSGLKAKVIIALAETIIVYLNGCYDQWEKIKPHLDEAEMYFKSADYYWKLLHP